MIVLDIINKKILFLMNNLFNGYNFIFRSCVFIFFLVLSVFASTFIFHLFIPGIFNIIY